MIYEVPVAFLPPSPITDQNHVEKFKFLTVLVCYSYIIHPFLFYNLFIYLFGFLRQGFSVALKPVLELSLVD